MVAVADSCQMTLHPLPVRAALPYRSLLLRFILVHPGAHECTMQLCMAPYRRVLSFMLCATQRGAWLERQMEALMGAQPLTWGFLGTCEAAPDEGRRRFHVPLSPTYCSHDCGAAVR